MSAARRAATLVAVAALAWASPACAQYKGSRIPSGPPPAGVAPVALDDVRIDEKLGDALPLDAALVDQQGRPFRLGSAFDGKRPVAIALVYYDCPMLCGLMLSGLARSMRENGLSLGKDFAAVAISFDPEEKPALAAERRRGHLQSIGVPEGGPEWPFLVGAGETTHRIADALGFRFKRDPVSGEWAHMAAIFVATPDGRISRYLYGIEYPPKDFRLALVEAASGKVGTSFDRFLLTCYRYDPASRKYEPYALGIVRAGGAAALVALTALIGALVWRERRSKARRTA